MLVGSANLLGITGLCWVIARSAGSGLYVIIRDSPCGETGYHESLLRSNFRFES